MDSRFVPLTARVGARVAAQKQDLTSRDFAAEVLAALDRYGVLLFPKIQLTDAEQVAFSDLLGGAIPQGPMRPDGTQEVVFKITIDPRENEDAAEYLKSTVHWHIDGIFDEKPPPKATLLTGRKLSAAGGQTEFCNTYAAYAELPEVDRRQYDQIRVMHSLVASLRCWKPDASADEVQRWRQRRAPKEHPLVWNHQTGRKSLVLGMTTDYVKGMAAADSAALIRQLTAFATRRENVYRHEWSVGDLLMWDNTGVMHRVEEYAVDSGRLMHRTIIYGTESIN
jgi:alpha-ketoglutarate-dependent taurine dioxygenase